MKVPIEETDRGGLELSIAFVKDNRIYTANQKIRVPWTNKELKINFTSYRDKTLPGETEKWKMKIEGFKKELVAAEVLSSMYDASLDQFRQHAWYIPGIYPVNGLARSWEGYLNFSVSWDQEWNMINNLQDPLRCTYDHLLFLGKAEWRESVPFAVLRQSMVNSTSDSSGAPGAAVEMNKRALIS